MPASWCRRPRDGNAEAIQFMDRYHGYLAQVNLIHGQGSYPQRVLLTGKSMVALHSRYILLMNKNLLVHKDLIPPTIGTLDSPGFQGKPVLPATLTRHQGCRKCQKGPKPPEPYRPTWTI